MDLVGFDFLEHAAHFQRMPIFNSLSYEETQALAPLIRQTHAAAGAVLVEQNALGSALFLILKGNVEVERVPDDAGGHTEKLAELGEGQMFGEMSLIDDTFTNARIKARNDVELLVIDRGPFEKLLASNASLASKVYRAFCKQLTQRLRHADALLAGKSGLLGHVA